TVGSQRQLTVKVVDSLGHNVANPTVTWTSTQSSIATVSSTGLVTGVASGSALIIAQSGSKADTNSTLVTSPTASSVTARIAANQVPVGQTTIVTATAKDSKGNVLFGQSVTWSSNATGVATVSAGGVDPSTQLDTATVTGVAAGNAKITATTPNNVSGNVSV